MATNTLGVYNPTFYAAEALIELRKALGLAGRVHRGFDEERRTFGLGDTISIRKPSSFTAQSAPSSAQNVTTKTVSITLSSWKEVKFELTDKELAYTGERIIRDHISPAAYALADDIDQALTALIPTVPHAYIEPSAATAATVAGIVNTRKKLVDLKVPVYDESNMHFMLGAKEEADLLQLSAFTQWQGAGAAGVESQMRGYLGKRYGLNLFTNQNRGTVAYANTTDVAGTITEPAAVGDTSITIGGFGSTDTLKKGTIIKFDTSGYEYAVSADITLSSGAGVVSINPAIRVAEADNAAITGQADQDNVTSNLNLAFHRNWAALAFAKLPDTVPANLGAQVASIQDPVTGLAVRSRMFYIGDSSKVVVALDVLYGVKELDADLACRYQIVNS